MTNGLCLQCGEPAFLMDTSIECSNNECKHFDYRVAVGLLEEPEFDLDKMVTAVDPENKDWYWFRNADKNSLPSYSASMWIRIGEPHGNDIYDYKELAKHGMVGLYVLKGSGVKKSGYVNSFGASSHGKKCPVIAKLKK